MNNDNSEVGKRIESKRKCRGYTRERLAEYADISVQFLADIERGRKSMTVATLRKIAAALNVTADYIVNGTESFPENERINFLLAEMSPYHQAQAEKLIAVFADALKNR